MSMIDQHSKTDGRREEALFRNLKLHLAFVRIIKKNKKHKIRDVQLFLVSMALNADRTVLTPLSPFTIPYSESSDGGVMVFLLGRRVDSDVSGMVELRPLGNISNSLPFRHICFSLGSCFSALGVGSKRMGYVTRSRASPFYLK
ncbi:hypothetical protein L2E82_39800 [Cichorium intybus]|uniref:Uncharacterized protein n=1 Tax=Cichorium intybus TaxID=13427 RepID=A0ACB9AIQ1_CICIN|nr:hypothetical protein L2E82_39800 [Cichorium intybus]